MIGPIVRSILIFVLVLGTFGVFVYLSSSAYIANVGEKAIALLTNFVDSRSVLALALFVGLADLLAKPIEIGARFSAPMKDATHRFLYNLLFDLAAG